MFEETLMARLQQYYRETVTPRLREQFQYCNVMEVPRITKITLNMGVGEAVATRRSWNTRSAI
jgi:large subunit ribosomal protein L5